MQNIRARRLPRNGGVLPLFRWAEEQRRIVLPLPARRLKMRFGLTDTMAVTIAELHYGARL